jgi:release factor glutamine methyltransferase
MLIKEAILWGYEQLTPTSDSPRVDAELLLAHVLKQSTTFLFTHDEQKISSFLGFAPPSLRLRWGYARNDKSSPIFFPLWRYKRLIRKRKQGIPVAYLAGHKEFYGLDFKVNRHVLVPRPDTETLVEAVIEYINRSFPNTTEGAIPQSRRRGSGSSPSVVLVDIGTGSGCIPISVIKNVPGLEAVAIDISSSALRVAKANVKKHHLQSRITLVRSNLLDTIDLDPFEDHEVILTANLPYLPDKMEVAPELSFEPSISLYGGSDGMDVYRRLMTQIERLRPKAIFLELYEWQIGLLQAQFPGYELKYAKTMSGDARCLMLERKYL